jgi:glutamate/tyrosine decarboxylase-like PLP-dependent enzyme
MITMPREGQPAEVVLSKMKERREQDARWQDGRTWSLVYDAGDEITAFLQEAYALFFSENGLNPMAFPSLRRFEAEVVAMTAALAGGNSQMIACG